MDSRQVPWGDKRSAGCRGVMNEQTEWWQILTNLSPFLIPVASAIFALLIRDLLDPQQWRRLVRKSFAGAASGILVFAGMASAYLILLHYIGNEESPIIVAAGVVIGLGIIPAPVLAGILAFRMVEPNLDRYINSRFVHSFHNDSWPILSVAVRTECLPPNVTFVNGRVLALREHIGEYRLRVVAGTGDGSTTLIERTTNNPGHGWAKMMRTVLALQLGYRLNNKPTWRERIPFSSALRARFRGPTNTPPPTELLKWQNQAYMRIHKLAERINAEGVLR